MKKQITQFFCDVCETQVEKADDLKPVEIPVMELDCEGRGQYERLKKVDMCRRCRGIYNQVVYDHFAKLTFGYGDTVHSRKIQFAKE